MAILNGKGVFNQVTAAGSRIALGLGPDDDVTFGSVTAGSLTGDGSGLTNIPASSITGSFGDEVSLYSDDPSTSTPNPELVLFRDRDSEGFGGQVRFDGLTSTSIQDELAAILLYNRQSNDTSRLEFYVKDLGTGALERAFYLDGSSTAVTVPSGYNLSAFGGFTVDGFFDSLSDLDMNGNNINTVNQVSAAILAGADTFTDTLTITGLGTGIAVHDGSGVWSTIDYEEGTWTPAFEFTTTTDVTHNIQDGTYSKTGGTVHIQCRISTTSIGASSGSIIVSGAPFDNTGSTGGDAASVGFFNNFTGLNSVIQTFFGGQAGISGLILRHINGTGTGSSPVQSGNATNTIDIMTACTYFTAV